MVNETEMVKVVTALNKFCHLFFSGKNKFRNQSSLLVVRSLLVELGGEGKSDINCLSCILKQPRTSVCMVKKSPQLQCNLKGLFSLR